MGKSSTERLGLGTRDGEDVHCKKPALGAGVGNGCWKQLGGSVPRKAQSELAKENWGDCAKERKEAQQGGGHRESWRGGLWTCQQWGAWRQGCATEGPQSRRGA